MITEGFLVWLIQKRGSGIAKIPSPHRTEVISQLIQERINEINNETFSEPNQEYKINLSVVRTYGAARGVN